MGKTVMFSDLKPGDLFYCKGRLYLKVLGRLGSSDEKSACLCVRLTSNDLSVLNPFRITTLGRVDDADFEVKLYEAEEKT